MVIALQSPEGELRLSTDETGWCTVEVLASGARYELGADTLDVVKTKLARGLDQELTGPSSGTIEGADVRWVLSLAERHCSVYVANVGGQRVLFFQGADGSSLERLKLSESDRARWLDALTAGRG